MVNRRRERVLQGADVPGDLSEEHAALIRREEHVGEPRGVGGRVDAAELPHAIEPDAEDLAPLREHLREPVAYVEIGLDDLARERAEAAAVLERTP